MTKIGERLKNLRIHKNATQREIAEKIGVSPVSMQRFEYGTVRPSLDTLTALADYFDVPLDYLVGAGIFGQLEEDPELRKIISEQLEKLLGHKLLSAMGVKSLNELSDITFARLSAGLIFKIERREDENAVDIFWQI